VDHGRRALWQALLLPALLLTALFVLWPGVHGPFLFDDFPNLKNLAELNDHVTLRNIGVYTSLFPGSFGRPLSAVSFLLNDVAWPSEPFGFKGTNLLIHLLNGVLVFGLARALGRARGGTDDAAWPRVDLVALACMAFWLLSPIQISAVFLVVQRMTELAATFAFAGLWAFVSLASRARTSGRAVAAVAALGAGTILSFLSKENGALVPLLALVTCWTLLAASLRRLPAWPRRILWFGMGLPSLAVLAKMAKFGLDAPAGLFPSRNFGLWERLMTEARVLMDYLALIVAPRLSSSSLYNDDYLISHGLLDPVSTLPAIAVIVLAFVAAIALRKRMPLLSFGILWYLAGQVMESSVVGLEIYFEHRNYVPLFGIALAVAASAFALKGHLRRPVLLGLAGWLALAATVTHLQARAWGDEARLTVYWHAEHPGSLRAQQQYASYLYARGQVREAQAVLARMKSEGSAANVALQDLTIECDTGGRTDDAGQQVERIGALLDTAQVTPGTALILQRLRASVQAGHCPGLVSAEGWLALTQHTMDNPNGSGLFRMLRVERAELFLHAKRLDPAIHELDLAYRAGDHEPRIAFYAAALLATAGRYDEARAWAKKPMGRPWNWKDWFAQTDRQARELVDAIDSAQQGETATQAAANRASQLP
jgi:hypothetical protein